MSKLHYPPNWLFTTPLAELTAPSSRTFAPDVTVGDLARSVRIMSGPAAICGADGALLAIVRDADVVDWLVRGMNLADRIPTSAATRVEAIAADRTCFDALTRMLANGTSELAVVNDAGTFTGFISRERILASASGFIFDIAQAGAHRGGTAASDSHASGNLLMRGHQLAIAREMLAAAIPADAILATLTEINSEVHRRVVADAIAALDADGWGPPPARFSFLVMGSSGRSENQLDPDQDNALVIADTEESRRDATATYFIALAERVTAGLAAAGFSYCKGNMMATSPVWRKTESEWRAQIRSWVRRKAPVLLMNCDTLLDMAHVTGDAPLASSLQRDLIDMARREPGFLRALYSIEEDHGVALDWLGRLGREKDDFGSVAEVNLKLRGLLPLVEGARLLSISAGISETSTTSRLRRLGSHGALDMETTDELIEAFRLITVRLLQHQIDIRETRSGSPIRVAHASMSRGEKAALRDALRSIARFRTNLPTRLEGSLTIAAHA